MNRNLSIALIAVVIIAAGLGGVVLLQGRQPAASPAAESLLPTPLPSAVPTATAMPSPTPTAAAVVSSPLAPPEAVAPPPSWEVTAAPVYGYRVVNEYPHDPEAFTQGLVYTDGALYEGTGLRGASSLRRVDPSTGAVLQQHDLAPEYFGEGIAILDNRIYQLTWQEHVGFVYDQASFTPQQQFSYPTEGWGITTDGTRLIMSDGSAYLYVLDPETLQLVDRIEVKDGDQPVFRLNELEWVNGEVLANVWQTDYIARIDPATGKVTGWIDLRGLLKPEDFTQHVDVLNGIAYDAAEDRLFVTGKLWPKLFEIELTGGK